MVSRFREGLYNAIAMKTTQKPHYRVVCAVITKDGRALAVQRSTTMKMPLLWEFPGGKVQDSESDESALIREINEELGCMIQIVTPLHVVTHEYSKFTIELIPFHAELTSHTIVLSEHINLHWCIPRELAALPWCEADIPVMEETRQLLEHV